MIAADEKMTKKIGTRHFWLRNRGHISSICIMKVINDFLKKYTKRKIHGQKNLAKIEIALSEKKIDKNKTELRNKG